MKKVLVFTDTRAEYGILKNTLNKIKQSKELELCIVVTGTHLLKKYGYTVNEILEDGFEIAERIEPVLEQDESVRISVEMGNLLIQLAKVFTALKPNILLLFGDRYEVLAAAAAAVSMHLPIAHISGGEITEGAMDEQIRHAVTKMAHIHFPGAAKYAENIKKMGEESWRIFNVGDPGIENVKKIAVRNKAELEEELKIEINQKTLLVTYHPVTLEIEALENQIENLIAALSNYQGTKIITYPNSDDGSELIIAKLKEFAHRDPSVCLVQSLGIERYISVMHYCGAVIGNSSSAIVEAPVLKKAVINIGNRQKGRLMAESIICCGNSSEEIEAALQKAFSPEFQKTVQESESLYGEGNTSEEIVKVLENLAIDEKLLKKKLVWGN